ncbi:hypothetical protein M9Y10_045739 [Tritrichomonas musculus]|uniref:Protein kinase domain-containing protein n=1 Tax=Tritrichomonas musculus TaxID=1915356 RepID=A0ABR2JW24_9EUKA
MSGEFNVQIYSESVKGRESPNYSQTVVSKGRIKESIDFVVTKSVDIMRKDEYYRAVKIMSKFKHDNIVQFFNWFASNTRLFLILEYCPGGTLLDLLERDVCLPESIVRIFSSDVLSALNYIHQHGYIFHDLSPRNILLDECGLLKLSDFARATEIDESLNIDLYDFEILEYIPPELLVPDSPSSFASDFYALGCLMYRMATGATPFLSSTVDELKNKILDTTPETVPECSPEFNDLVLRCLDKNPYKRPTWKEMVNHPFWQDSLTDRLDQQFKNFNEKLMPPQPVWEAMQNNDNLFKSTVDLSKSLRKSFISSKSKTLTSTLKSSLFITSGSLNSTGLNDTIKSNDSSIIDNDVNDSEGPKIEELMVDTSLFEPATVVLNPNIESFPLPSTDGISLPVTASMLKSNINEAIPKLKSSFDGPDRVKSKAPILSFLIVQSKTAEVANNFANTTFFEEIVSYAKATKHPSLAAGFLLLYGTILKFATKIQNQFLTTESINNLQVLSCSPQEKISRKAISVLGQLATYIVNGSITIEIPSFLIPTILKALKSPDEPVKHYALRTVANLLIYGYDINKSTLENALISFDYGQSQYLIETYAICVGLFYSKFKSSSNDFVSNLIKNFISRSSPALQTLAIIIASSQGIVPTIKDGIISCFKNSAGDLRAKAFLSMCLLFKSNPSDFIEYSQRFFHVLEKMSSESPIVYECVARWSVEYCESIVDNILQNSDIELLTIVYSAMQMKQFSTRIWTPKFEKKIAKVIRNNTFCTSKSEVAIQIVQCAICYQLCDYSIVADLCRPLNSQLPTVRFAVVKLIADAASQKPFPQSVMSFIENNILNQILPLLQDEDIIVDQTLRILSVASEEKPDILKTLSKPNIITYIFNSICDNQAGQKLSTQLIASNEVSIDCLVNTRFVPAVIGSLDKKENMEYAIELLYVTLSLIEKKKGKRNLNKSFHNLATMAPKMASLILEYPRAGNCLCLLTKIFTPQGNQNEVVIESAFNPLATSISAGYQKQEFAAVFSEVIRTLQWSAENSQATRLKLKGSKNLMAIIKKAADNGADEVKQAAISCIKAIK